MKLDETLVEKIRGIQIRARHLVNNSFAGEYQSAFKGRGLEFEEVREYQPGDDIRMIDWNVTARTGHPFIKLHRDERELTVIFLVDVSASSHFGSVKKFKNEIAAELTALLAYSALRNNDKVGLIIFSDQVEHYLPAKKGRGHVWQLIRDILTYQSKSKKTNLGMALDFLNCVVKKRSIVFLVSDFQTDEYQQLLRMTAKHHDLIALLIQDRREVTFPNIGYIELEDSETGETLLIDTYRKDVIDEFSGAVKSEMKKQNKFFTSSGIDFIRIQTDKPYLDPIIKFFREREKKMGR